ncbi:FtsX-like permease family protein [Streptomyces sp. NPDC088387]|uniref:FtsX-like permease family protein n=1 Tax=Streptomyces sp. NPDC088387 TaxID=3365859 RepID=UPI00381D883E
MRRPGRRTAAADHSPALAAPWIRTRLRAAPAAAWALLVLVALTACLAAVFPRAVDRYQDDGLRRALDDAGADRSTVQLDAPEPDVGLSLAEREKALRPQTLARQFVKVGEAAEAPFTPDRHESAYGVRTLGALPVPERWIPQPSGLPAQVTLVAQSGLADHSRLESGRLPRVSAPPVTARTPEVEAAVSAETAERMHIRTGSVIHVPGVGREPLAVRVTGVFAPTNPGGSYWSTVPLLRTPALVRVPDDPDRGGYWLGALHLAPEAAPAMLGTDGKPSRYWYLAPATGPLHAHDLSRLRSAVAGLESGPGLRAVRQATDIRTEVQTDLDDVVTEYERLRAGVRPLIAVAAVGTGTVAAVVLVMAGGLAAERRRSELALLRARGASLRGLAARLLGETAVVAVPAGAAGLGAALLLVPEGRRTPALLAALAVTVAAAVALPLRAVAAHRVVRVHDTRADVTSVRPSRRRTVAELTLVVLAVGAVVTLRRRGTAGDELASVAPVLVAVIAALVLVRLYPLPLRGLARPAARLRGAVGHLSLARAGRGSASAVLPLLALSIALTTAAFGGSVVAGVHEARDRAALLAVGADARVEATAPLPADVPDRVREAPGVRSTSVLSVDYQAHPNAGRQSVPFVGADVSSYAALATHTGLGGFGADELRRPTSDRDPLPALASRVTADTYGTRPFPVRLGDGTTVTVRIALVRESTPAVAGTEFLVVDRAGLGSDAARPTAVLATGSAIGGDGMRAAAADSDAHVQLRSEERERFVDSPLQAGVERLYAAAVVAGAGFAVLALLLSLLRAAPERAALLARLRTMGLTRAQGRRLLVLESLPQAALAAMGGALTGWATIRLLAPGVDLTSIALPSDTAATVPAELHTDALSLAVPATAVLLLTLTVATTQAWWTGRRSAVTELRAGDAR